MADAPTRWPGGYAAAVSITMDNMGEAADLYRGNWPAASPQGEHYSVTEALPRMLEFFDECGVQATYFIEGWNTGIYASTIQEIHNRGHEVGFHGWQHEPWSTLDPDGEDESILRNVDAFQQTGVDVRGFRPPGGVLTERSIGLLRSHGLVYCSPAGETVAVIDGLVILPFKWRGIDAYYYSETFAPLRGQKGDSTATMSPARLVETMSDLIETVAGEGGYTALLFHPFLENQPDRFNAMRHVISSVVANDRIWCAPCGDVADWVLTHPDSFGADPGFDLTTWARS